MLINKWVADSTIARSLILAAFSFLAVSFAGIYFGNLEQNQNLLAALGEKLPVTAALTNSTGDRLAGLDITEKRMELFRGLVLKDYVITAEPALSPSDDTQISPCAGTNLSGYQLTSEL